MSQGKQKKETVDRTDEKSTASQHYSITARNLAPTPATAAAAVAAVAVAAAAAAAADTRAAAYRQALSKQGIEHAASCQVRSTSKYKINKVKSCNVSVTIKPGTV